MKLKLLDILLCPICGTELYLTVFRDKQEGSDPEGINGQSDSHSIFQSNEITKETYRQSGIDGSQYVEIGVLQCMKDSAHLYPVVNGIPRMLVTSLNQFSHIITRYIDQLPTRVNENLVENLSSNSKVKIDRSFEHIQRSFSAEWLSFKQTEMAWGRDFETRYQMFHTCLNLPEGELSKKRILDAGCGHGEIEFALLNSEAEIYAIDLSFSVDDLQNRLGSLTEKPLSEIHIIQGNIQELPFKNESFDIVYCDGVLHHTPNTYQGFKSITNAVKPGGFCYVMVYSHEHKNFPEKIRYYFTKLFRKLTVKMPHRILHALCFILAPLHWLYVNTYNFISSTRRYTRRSLRETELSLFDGFSPMYDWHHSTSEVKSWFKELGYTRIKKTFYNQSGIGIFGQVKSPKNIK